MVDTKCNSLLFYLHSLFQECAVFAFDRRKAEKIFKIKLEDMHDPMINRIRRGIIGMANIRNRNVLQIIHKLEEDYFTLAFATEPVLGSLHNILQWQVSKSLFIKLI